MKDLEFTNSELNAIVGTYEVDQEAIDRNEPCKGGGDGWGGNTTVGLDAGKTYLVTLLGWQKLDPDFLAAGEGRERMPNNLRLHAREVYDRARDADEFFVGGWFDAVVGGSALAKADCSTAELKSAAVAAKTPFIVSFTEKDTGKTNDDGSRRMKKIWEARRATRRDLQFILEAVPVARAKK